MPFASRLASVFRRRWRLSFLPFRPCAARLARLCTATLGRGCVLGATARAAALGTLGSRSRTLRSRRSAAPRGARPAGPAFATAARASASAAALTTLATAGTGSAPVRPARRLRKTDGRRENQGRDQSPRE